jgi:probable DNA metabolism protein
MSKGILITYDGSFPGFLSIAFAARLQKLSVDAIKPVDQHSESLLFQEHQHISTRMRDAKEIWELLGGISLETQRYVYFSFLSERSELQIELYKYVQLLMQEGSTSWEALFEIKEQLSPWAQRVGTEKGYLERHMKFSKTPSGIHYSEIKPIYNVLPLLTRHCRNRFKKELWAIYDTRRGLGLRNLNGQIVRFVRPNNAVPAKDIPKEVARKTTGNQKSVPSSPFSHGKHPKRPSLRVSA